MKDETVLQFLKRRLREAMETNADHIATGGCADWSEYKRLTGVIEGLALAEREVLDLIQRLEGAED